MNLLLHGAVPDQMNAQLDALLPVRTDDALRELCTVRYDIVATNPPFGRKSSIKVIGEAGEVSSDAITDERDDVWATTSNKQLNFVQHIKSLLKINGRAGSAQAATKRLWVYDLRTNKHFTLKTRPLQPADLEEFVSLYNPGAIAERQTTWSEANPEGRWRAYELEELLDSDNLPDPDLIAAEIADDLRSALEQMEAILADLEATP